MTFVDLARFFQFEPHIARAIRELFAPHDDWLSASQIISEAVRRQFPEADPLLITACVDQYLRCVRSEVLGFDPFKTSVPAVEPSSDPGVREEADRALIDHLIATTKLYSTSESINELMLFVSRMRSFAPFNAMLLHIQKPGLTHAATATDWHRRFGRTLRREARPLLILRTMGPVDFVFDIMDTEGDPLPQDAFSFPTFGSYSDARFESMLVDVSREKIAPYPFDAGDGKAGWIRLTERAEHSNGKHRYELGFNRNHPAPTRFVTVAHELGHLFLGHLGRDAGRNISDRRHVDEAMREVEAETTAYLVAIRNGLKPTSESYLANYQGAFEDLDLFAVTKAANAVEATMGVSAHKLWGQAVNNI